VLGWQAGVVEKTEGREEGVEEEVPIPGEEVAVGMTSRFVLREYRSKSEMRDAPSTEGSVRRAKLRPPAQGELLCGSQTAATSKIERIRENSEKLQIRFGFR
jgi:hypothetical protein